MGNKECTIHFIQTKGDFEVLFPSVEKYLNQYLNNPTMLLKSVQTPIPYIIPFVSFLNYGFQTSRAETQVHAAWSLIQMNKTNAMFFYEKLKDLSFYCSVIPDFNHLIHLIVSKQIYIYALIKEHKMKSMYVFKYTTMLYCMCSINFETTSEFIVGFEMIINKLKRKMFQIQNISDNATIISHYLKNQPPYIVYPVYYYVYGEFQYPILEKDVCLVHP